MTPNSASRILITGVTGYVGGRLIHTLEQLGRDVCCLTRNRAFAESRVSDSTRIIEGDALNPLSLKEAMEGVHTAFYLIHSMVAASGFEE